jgi:hypothetical protein
MAVVMAEKRARVTEDPLMALLIPSMKVGAACGTYFIIPGNVPSSTSAMCKVQLLQLTK